MLGEPKQYEFIEDLMADVELMVRQRNATQRELDLYKGNDESRRAEIDRLSAEIDRLMNECF